VITVIDIASKKVSILRDLHLLLLPIAVAEQIILKGFSFNSLFLND